MYGATIAGTLRVCGWLFFFMSMLLGAVTLVAAFNANSPSASTAGISSSVTGLAEAFYFFVSLLTFVSGVFLLAFCQAIAHIVDNLDEGLLLMAKEAKARERDIQQKRAQIAAPPPTTRAADIRRVRR